MHTPHPSYRIGLAVFLGVLHLLFLLYLHFAYHELAEGNLPITEFNNQAFITLY
jgi:hypothetical protein